MAPSSPESALRHILDHHVAQISEEMERLLAASRERDRRESAELREQDRQEFAELLARERQQAAELRERERQEYAESRELEQREFSESLAREQQKAAELREHSQQEFAESLERERQQATESRERERREFAELRELEQREFTESLEREQQQATELRELARQEFAQSLARERQESGKSLEHEQRESAGLRERERMLFDTLERERQEFGESRERERREFADQLNQAVRRIRQSVDWEALGATLVDAAALFSGGGAAWLRVADGKARGRRIRGVPEDAEEGFGSLEIPLTVAAALAGAVESRDPVIAETAEGQVSAALLSLPGHPTDGRVAIFPLVTKDGVPGLLYTWGDGQEAVLEMLTQVAAAIWQILTPPPPPAPELVRIAGVPVPAGTGPGGAPRSSWEQLSAEEQQIHLRAQRYARVQAAEMRLHEADAVESGRARHNLYAVLQNPIDQARTTFHQKFFMACPSMVDYLHLELVRTLANDDAELLGTDYPGPLV